MNIRGGVSAKVEALAQLFCHDIVGLAETWLTEFDQPVEFPGYSCHSAFRPHPTTGRMAGGLSVYISDRLHAHVDLSNVLRMLAIYGSG